MDDSRHESGGTGYEKVNTEISCLLTRFQVRSLWGLAQCYLSFRRVRAEARNVKGLLMAVFLIEDLKTCYTFSLWIDVDAILEFNERVHAHTVAANRAFRVLRFGSRLPELWSAQFRLSAVSPYNLCWGSLDLRKFIER